MDFDKLLKKYRKACKMSQADLANKSGIALISIRRYESGSRVPRYDVIKRLADSLNIPVNYLIDVYPSVPAGPPRPLAVDSANGQKTENVYGAGFNNIEQARLSRVQYYLSKLNDKGKDTAINRIRELTLIPEYQIENKEDKGQ